MLEEKIEKIKNLIDAREQKKKELEEIDDELKKVIGGAKSTKKKTVKKTVTKQKITTSSSVKKIEKKDTKNEVNKKSVKKWSRKFDACIDCGTTEIPHIATGKCRRCYQKNGPGKRITSDSSKFNRNRIIENSTPIKSSCVNSFICERCETEFKSVLDKLDAVCPECKSIAISYNPNK